MWLEMSLAFQKACLPNKQYSNDLKCERTNVVAKFKIVVNVT